MAFEEFEKNGETETYECRLTYAFAGLKGKTLVNAHSYGDRYQQGFPDYHLAKYYLKAIQAASFADLPDGEQTRLKRLAVFYGNSILKWSDWGAEHKSLDYGALKTTLQEIAALEEPTALSPNLRDRLAILRLSEHNVFDLSNCRSSVLAVDAQVACFNSKKLGKKVGTSGDDKPKIVCRSSSPGVYEIEFYKKVAPAGKTKKANTLLRTITIDKGRFEFNGLRPCSGTGVESTTPGTT
ncbi:MAG: hypothetical protein ABL958_15590 [Bdellovibrionia bacterium]